LGKIKLLKNKIVSFIAPELIQLYKRKTKSNIKTKYHLLDKFPRYSRTKVDLFDKEIIIPDSASFLFMYKEIFDENIYQFKTSNPAPYIIDGGANIGLSSIYLKLLYPKSKIIAFEPDYNIYTILKKNIDAFNFKGIDLINKGLWNKEATLSFKAEGADAGLLTEVDATESVSVLSLKPYLNKKVDFLKLDIEGAETVVLKDIEENLSLVERIFVEYHSFVGKTQSINEIIDILIKAKFRIYMSIPGNNSLKSPLMGLGSYNNMDFQLNIFGYKEDLEI